MPRDSRRWDEDDEDDRPRRRRRDEDDEEEDDRPRRRAKSGGSNGMAVTALVLGILSFFCSALTGLPAVIFGLLGLAGASKTGRGKGMAIAGMILGIAGTVVTSAAVYLTYLGMSAVRDKFEQASGNFQATDSARRISLASHDFHDRNFQFPRSYHVEGTPTSLPPESSRLSWRVSLLPHLHQQHVFSRFNANEAWNSARNKPASDTYVSVYGDVTGSTLTRYRVFVGGGALFNADPPQRKGAPLTQQMAEPVKLTGVTDGTSNTFFCVEAAETVPWAQHNELRFTPNGPLPSFGRLGTDTFVVAMCDGSTRIVKKNTDPKVLRALITRAGGETVPLDW